MTRILDANEKFVGKEPKFTDQITESELGSALSWYSNNKNSKDSHKYATDFFKKKYKLEVGSVIKSKPQQFGFICRILLNGGSLSEERAKWFSDQVEEIKQEVAKIQTEEVIDRVKKPNIQDRIREKADVCIGELEGQIDDLISSKFTANTSPYGIFHTLNIKDVQTKYILDWAKRKRLEYDYVLHTDESDIKEGYSNFKKTELKKMIGFFDQVILDCSKISTTVTRKPRKRKAKSPAQIVSKMKFCKEFTDLKLVSIDPETIVGANQLWVYNTKNRKLGIYHAIDASGLMVKGSTITNFAESRSIQKTLRKPDLVLKEVLTGGKVALRNIIGNIRAVESNLTGRINADTILVRIVK
jgi:hypothetical protein